MSVLLLTILSLTRKQNSKLTTALFALLTICLFGWVAEAKDGGDDMMASAETSTYVFLSDQSTVIQTGGIAGVHETYSIEGQLQLTVDFDAGIALFHQVDANLIEESSFLYTQSLGVLFNMTELIGTVVGDMTVKFEGKTTDGTNTNILLRLAFTGASAHLVGETIPPPGSADFFNYKMDAVAWKKYGGTGESNNPYLIYTAEQMNDIGVDPDDWDKHFKLMADIDLSGYTGTYFSIIGYFASPSYNKPFTGVFDGNGHTISNFSYTSTDANYVGLFGYVHGENAQIKDLGLIDPNVDAGTGDYVGSLVGFGGPITNCYAQGGSISGTTNVGGLAGGIAWGTISNCYYLATVSGITDVGGLVGWNEGQITNCYSSGDVSGDSNVGGLAGINWEGTITNSYSTSSVSGAGWVGGLVGLHRLGAVTCSFWDTETSRRSNMCGRQGPEAK